MTIQSFLETLRNWLLLYPILDVGLGILWIRATASAWRAWTGLGEQDRQTAQGLEERRLGATIILGEIQYLIVGSSIILTGVGAFAALAINQQASNLVKHCVGYAAAWAVLALAMGVYATCLLPHHTLSRNFILVKDLNIWLSLGVFMFAVAAFRLLVAVILLLMS